MIDNSSFCQSSCRILYSACFGWVIDLTTTILLGNELSQGCLKRISFKTSRTTILKNLCSWLLPLVFVTHSKFRSNTQLITLFNLKACYPLTYTHEVWHYSKANIDMIRKTIYGFNWKRTFRHPYPNAIVHLLNKKLFLAMTEIALKYWKRWKSYWW